PRVPEANLRPAAGRRPASGEPNSLLDAGRKELRRPLNRHLQLRPNRHRVIPDAFKRLARQGPTDLLGSPTFLRILLLASTTTPPSSLNSLHAGSLLLEQRKDAVCLARRELGFCSDTEFGRVRNFERTTLSYHAPNCAQANKK